MALINATASILIFLEIYLCQSLCKSIVDGLLGLFFLFIQIPLDVSFAYAGPFFFSSGLEAGEFLLIAAGRTDKGVFFALQIQFHLSVTVGTPGIGKPGDGLSVSAGPILAHQHFTVLAIYRQHSFSAHRTFGVGKIVMAEGSVTGFDLSDKFFCIVLDILQKDIFL